MRSSGDLPECFLHDFSYVVLKMTSQRNATRGAVLKWGFNWLEIVEKEKKWPGVHVRQKNVCVKHERSISSVQNFN